MRMSDPSTKESTKQAKNPGSIKNKHQLVTGDLLSRASEKLSDSSWPRFFRSRHSHLSGELFSLHLKFPPRQKRRLARAHWRELYPVAPHGGNGALIHSLLLSK